MSQAPPSRGGLAIKNGGVVGDYMLGRKLGSGSFSVVWHALHRIDGTEMAIKEIATYKMNEKLQESLMSEILVLKEINHPNIIRLHDIIEVPGKIYLVLEYCRGGDLSLNIQRHRKIPETIAKLYMYQLVAGLQMLRDHNLIHRDLDPQNLLLTTNDNNSVLKIADFGFARSLQLRGRAETLCGSPLYIAPEIMQLQKYDAKANLWSIGTILYQVVTGKTPFTGNDRIQLLPDSAKSAELLFPLDCADLSSECRDLCQKLLRRNPVERLTFEEFVNHPFLSQEPLNNSSWSMRRLTGGEGFPMSECSAMRNMEEISPFLLDDDSSDSEGWSSFSWRRPPSMNSTYASSLDKKGDKREASPSPSFRYGSAIRTENPSPRFDSRSGTVFTGSRGSALSMVADLPRCNLKDYESPGELATQIVKFLHSEATGHSVDNINVPAPSRKHDVFLSFRGEDTRKGFLSHLYHELQNTRLMNTFKDDEQLEKGTAISSNLLMAIEESRFAIIVLSQNYASSTWCLDELAKIYECMKEKDSILPIFYHVNPSDVRHQRKKFKDAFIMHKKSADRKKVNLWRAALKGVAGIVGWDIKNYRTERELVEDIVNYVWRKVLKEPTRDFEAFGATRQATDEVLKALKDDKVIIIGVHGIRGVGKTTMVKHVGLQAQNNGLFDNVIMVDVSEFPDLQKIQVTLANFLGLKLEEDTDIGRASRLEERMLREKKILIILDDLWEGIALSSIGLPNSEDLRTRNCKLILTTRIRRVCHSMQCHAKIHLNVLSEEDSCMFLMKKSGKSFLESTDSYNEARKVARKCDGLPNALKAAARALGDQYMEEWNKAVARAFGDSNLEKWNEEAQLVNFKVDRDVFYSLASEAKSCLLLCCLFPEDYEIPIEDMLKYGIGKGLFRYDTIQEARDRAYSVVNYLKASRLLLDGTKKGCIRMHNEMRDAAMSVALSEEGHGILVKAGCELKDWPEDAHRGYSAISLMRNKLCKLPKNLVCAELQILLLQCNVDICEIPDTCFQSSNTLRVFDLSFTSVGILPASFNLLTNLQALKLDCCKELTDISILGRLSKLEILSMRKCPLKKFPTEIGHLTNLRMLDVTGGCVETVPSNVLSRLYRLEELHMKVEFGDWGSKMKEAVEETNAEFDELTGLSYLNILKVYISDAACLPKNVEQFKPNWVEYDICISKDVPWDMVLNHPSRSLTLDTTIKSLPDWFINVVTEKAENLEYINFKDLSNILVEYNHGRLHRLKHLSVNGRHQNLEELMNTITWVPDKPVFERLEKLHLLYLQSLKRLCVGELPPGSLCSLKLLKVQTCRSLENALLPSKLLQKLRNLEKIICVNMEVMKYVFSFEGLDPEKSLLSNLKEMRLCSLFELVRIWNGPAPHAFFHNLQVLAVCECKKLKNLFTFDVAECLFHLEDLCIERCPNLDRVIDPSESLNSKIIFPALKNLALINLPELKSFCTESGTIKIECPSLVNLYVEECPQFPNMYDFGSRNLVHFNDQQHLSSLVKRWEEMYK